MKPVKTKSIRMGAFRNWRYAGSIAGISFFACPKNKGSERIVLPGNIITIAELGNLRFSLPPVAILAMEIYKKPEIHKEIPRSGFKSEDTLPEGITHSYSAARNILPAKAETQTPTMQDPASKRQQKIIDGVLSLDRDKFHDISELMKTLPEGATRQQKLEALFDIIKIGGTLGIKYDLSEDRKPKSPNEVLIPDKDGKLKADCDELSLLFLASAKKLGIDISDARMLVFGMNLENISDPSDKMELKHANLLLVGEKSFLFDPAFDISREVKNADKHAIAKSYEGDFAQIGLKNFRIISVSEEVEELKGLSEICAIYSRVSASYDINSAVGAEPNKKVRQLAIAESAVKDGLTLQPGNEELKEQAKELLATYQNFAKEAYSGKQPELAMEYSKKMLDLAALLPSSDSEVNERAAFAEKAIGVVFRDRKHHEAALLHFEESLKLNPSDTEAWINRGVALCDLKRYAEAEAKYGALHNSSAKNIEVIHLGLRIFSGQKNPDALLEISKEGLLIDKTDGQSHHCRVSAQISLAEAAYDKTDTSGSLELYKTAESYALEAKSLVKERKFQDEFSKQLDLIHKNIRILSQ